MNLKWKLFANFAEVAGMREIEIETYKGLTVENAMESLFERIPKLREEIFDENDRVYKHVKILHNGGEIKQIRYNETIVFEGDELAVIPPMSGG
jgi:MoaD family protein